ncbi:CHC2 zinc finger domain-containing protein [Woeseia oceani]|uniref:CHC2 zinc finger domain-containing protein n=1 Tax=Woeseia oceani TaxID=1548547 RepID=UPI000A7F03A5
MSAALIERLDGVRETGKGRYLARCPAHDDRTPSLSVRDTGDRVLLHCFAGCDALDVVHALGLELADLFADKCEHRTKPMRTRIPAADALDAISHEAHVCAAIAADVHSHCEIDTETWERLAIAVSRISDARCYR